MNLGFLTNIKSPYKSLQMKEFSQIPGVTLNIYYTEPSNNKIKWEEKKIELNEYNLKEIHFLKRCKIILNLGLKNIVKNNDIILISGYDQLSMIFTSILCKLNKKPYVVFFDGISVSKIDSNENYFKKIIKKQVIKNSFAAMANGEVGKRYLNEKLGYNLGRIYNQFLSIDSKSILSLKKNSFKYRTTLREKYNIDKNEIVILYSGRLISKKNILTLINAISEIKEYNIRLFITGGGELEEDIIESCKNKDIKLTITGFIGNQKELFKHYFLADMLVLPSIDEPWGLVVNEAMTADLPVIVSKECGCSLDLIENGVNGFIIDPLDAIDIKNKIEKVIINNKDNCMGKKSGEIIEKWNFQNSKLNLERIINRCINEKSF
ncbi:glycosyltransferase family 4 protein [Clostridium perfringens]|uniref:glycosyltransferase family 4 protein n=1 Tax=Clostridium perfringens TaxID=1502 RepID=UPI002468CCA7|nr:glycosyltransferase family 4 protein [Clostridium perfringens]MDH5084128.1 Alpha-D-kanosaminyltransferase [Clostridium perfringens]MDK0904906.1 glycosyltransferase family 4 protein [Clostridium perfringens]MDM0966381.1 glycosyltransferase family 4 protein [Clostridium perfringens]MDM0983854.1 glycosyltransferase family 4 protein [Clostridium perfringens]